MTWMWLLFLGTCLGTFGIYGKFFKRTPKPTRPMVDVNKCQLSISFDTLPDKLMSFEGSALWSHAFGVLPHTGIRKAEEFIADPTPIMLDDGISYVPRSRVVLYKIHNAEPHMVQAKRV